VRIESVGQAAAAGARAADISLLRRADAAGQRLFRELVVSRIAWRAVSEASRLIAVDVVAFSLRCTGCSHPQPCHLHHCFDRLEMRAVLGNRGPRLPGLRLAAGTGVGGRVLETGGPVEVTAYSLAEDDPELLSVVADEEGILSMVGVPVSFGGEVRGVLHAGLRHDGGFGPAAIEALSRLCTYAGAALAAASDRLRVEEVAALRERRRLARALHDELGQRLFGIGVTSSLARASAAAGRADLVSHLAGLETQIAGASAALRSTLRSLDRPSAPAGALAVKLREDAASFSARTGVAAHLLVLGEPEPIDEAREDLLVRVAREGLRNVERHAGAHEVVVTIAFAPGSIELVVQDDGVGVTGAGPVNGVGLGMLREEIARLGGDARLARNEDAGSTMRTRLPLK
jgi:LuxR family transcriptional regulator, regulator of acetate metabolism